MRPAVRIVFCIRIAARLARAAWSSPSNSSSAASPPHFTSPAPSSYAIGINSPNSPLRTSFSSSAPILPRRARRSVMLVKPEMSMNASVPSISRAWRSGTRRTQS
jgi:hypothetical protein